MWASFAGAMTAYTTDRPVRQAPCCRGREPRAGRRQAWSLVKEESTFVDWQRVKVQENSDEARAPRRGLLPPTGRQGFSTPPRA